MSRLGFGAVLAAGLLGLASAATAAPISSAQEGWAAIKACAGMEIDEARRDCMDGVLRRAGLLVEEPRAGRPAPPPPVERPHVLGVPLPVPPEAEDETTTTVAKAQIDGDGRLVLVTAEGEAWRSEDGGREAPKPGHPITIKPTGMGIYECRLSRWDSFLCRRDLSVRRPG